MSLQPGTPVERYIVQAVLGRGGMATVYRVKHAVLGTQHALKVLHTHSVTLQEDLLREGRMQARLDPEYIVPVHDVLTVHGSPGLLMPLVQGCSLQDVLNAYRPTEAEIAAVMTAVARGVGAAHAQGIVHRDLKPANVLLDIHRGRVRVRVADFGLGVSMEQGTHRRGFAGTPAYAPPEQLAGGAAPHPGQDLWALGVMLVECLTGKRPYDGESVADYITAIQSQPLSLDGIEEHWLALISQLLLPDLTQRMSDALEVATRLSAMVTQDAPAHGEGLTQAIRAGQWVESTASVAASGPAPLGGTSQDTFMDWEEDAPEEQAADQTNILPPRDAFIGRVRDLEILERHVAGGHRLITLLGMGGMGKTRLAREYGRRTVAEWAGGVWFCDLTEARTQNGILNAIAKALDVPLGERDPMAQVGHAIAGRDRVLVIFDNVEQVAEVMAPMLRAWMAVASEAVFMATSRVVLGVPGECQCVVQPLRPEASVALFMARAQMVKPGFTPSETEAADIETLVERLDHLPLSIELAAARVKMMTPGKMVSRIGQRFKLLSSRGGETQRHQTLRATLDWSWDLLTGWEQATLAQCSVFEGGFDLEAVESVLDLSEHDDAPWEMDAMQSLVDKSLVSISEDDRFALLRTVQAYAAERLEEQGGRRAAERRHGVYYAAMGSQDALDARHGPEGMTARQALIREFDNLMVAWERARVAEAPEVAVPAVLAAIQVLLMRGPMADAVSLAKACRSVAGIGSWERAELYLAEVGANRAAYAAQGNDQLLDELEQSVETLDARQRARVMYERALVTRYSGDEEGCALLLRKAVVAYREAGHTRGEGFSLNGLSQSLFYIGKFDEGERAHQRARALCQRRGDTYSETLTLLGIGNMQVAQMRLDEAEASFRQYVVMARAIGDQKSLAIGLHGLARVSQHRGDLAQAERACREALTLVRRCGAVRLLSPIWDMLASTLELRGEFEAAREGYAQAMRVGELHGENKYFVFSQFNLGDLLYRHGRWGEAEPYLMRVHDFGVEYHRGFEGVALGTLAKLYARTGKGSQALDAIDRGEALVAEWGRKDEIAKHAAKQATVYALCGRIEGAHAALTRAVNLGAELPGANLYLVRELNEARTALGIPVEAPS